MLVLRIIVALCSSAGIVTILLTWAFARSAPQESAGYTMALAFAVVPYVFYRGILDIVGVQRVEAERVSTKGPVEASPQLAREKLSENTKTAIWAAAIGAFIVGGFVFMSMFEPERVNPSATSNAARQACQEFKAARGGIDDTSVNPTAIACKERGYW